jgi:RNA polymerase sigma factor (sigma-70 family)
MKRKDGVTTSPLLLKRVANWADHPAWCDFFRSYDSLIHFWCRGYNLDDGTCEDPCQQIWVELADRMRSYQYDPGKTFPGWLRQFCHSRAVDLLRKRATEPVRFLDELPADALVLATDAIDREGFQEPESQRSLLLRHAEQVQRTVSQRAEPRTWLAFWRIAIDGCSFRETAADLGMSYAAVFAAHKRVGRMLRVEGERHLTQWYPVSGEARAPDIS